MEARGTGETWILLRGLVREQRHWEDFPRVLAGQLPAGSRILAVDLPGNGVRCHEDSPWRIDGMVDGLRADLASRGVQGPFSVVALSLGAMTAFEWMSLYPGEVARAVLINTSLSAYSPFWHRLRPANYGPILRELLFGHDVLTRERLILGITANLAPGLDAVAQRWAGYARERPVSRRNGLVQLASAARYRRPERPPACPVLIVNGGADRLVDPRCSDRIAAVYGLPLERHPTAGHDLALDAPGWLAERIALFGRATTAGRPAGG